MEGIKMKNSIYFWIAFIVLVCCVIILFAFGKRRGKEFTQRQKDLRGQACSYGLITVAMLDLLLYLLHSFEITVPFYVATLGVLFVGLLVTGVYEIANGAYWPENAKKRSNGWAWTFLIIGILLLIGGIIPLFRANFGDTAFIDLMIGFVLTLDGYGIIQANRT